MKSNSLVNPRIVAITVCGMALAFGLFAPRVRADEWDKMTKLTVNQTIQITDKVLPPGQYTLKLMESSSDRHIVQIYNGTETKYIGTVLAIPAYRMDPTGDTKFVFWETPPGKARALRAWYYPGDNYGQSFPYPKQLVSLETTAETTSQQTTTETATNIAPPVAPPVAAPPVTQPEEQPQAQPEEQPATPPVTEQQQPTPTPVQPNSEPMQSTGTANRSLPATGSPYPEIGAFGLLCLLAFGGLRFVRTLKQ